MSDRAALASRAIPFMTLSDGSSTSKTAAPQYKGPAQAPVERALARFAVSGSAIVTGGAGTLGLSAARALLDHGASAIALFDLPSTLATSEPSIIALESDYSGIPILRIPIDVTDALAVDTAVQRFAAEHGPVRQLLCFAGIVGCLHALDMTPEQWRKTLDVNTTGAFLCAQAVAKVMRDQGTGGSIVLVASISGHRVNFPQPQVAYNVSKAALIAMKNSLAAEWAVHGVRVNTISPGYMDTVLNEGPGLEEARGVWASRCPMGRMGAVGELDGAVIMLCSSAGTYITGADIVIDGGAIVF